MSAIVVAALLVVGCGEGSETLPGPTQVTGRFAGVDESGVGVAVDFEAFDATTQAIRAALEDPTAWSIGLVSIVNRSTELHPVPGLFVTRPNGRVQRLALATVVRRAPNGPTEELVPPGPLVPQEGAVALYVVFKGRPTEIRRLEMRVGEGPIVELTPQEAPKSQAGSG